jgi:N-acetylglucosamine-6-sulfatase
MSGNLRLRGAPATLVSLAVALVGVAVVAFLLIAASASAAPRYKRPNVVLIQTDDQTLGQFRGALMPKTERLLVGHGTEFTNYIATAAQCCPSRASLITGQYPHNDGITSNGVGYAGLRGKRNVLPVWLRQAGYRTMHVGAKYLNGYEDYVDPSVRVAPGWDEWFTSTSPLNYYNYGISNNGQHAYRGGRRKDYIGRVLAAKAKHLIETFGPHRPYYLQLDVRAPHISGQADPYGACDFGRAIPDPRDEGRFNAMPLPDPASFNEQDMGDKPPFFASTPALTLTDTHNLLVSWHCALASVAEVDRTVRKLVTAVKRTGELRRTVFIYVSDNGLFYGEHRIRSGKIFPYEEALHLPFVIRVPKRYRLGAVRPPQVGKPVGNIDIAPTILALAHAKPCRPGHGCRRMDGRSLMPLLTDSGAFPDDRGLLTEYRVPTFSRHSTCQFAGIRLRDEMYVEHYRVVRLADGSNRCEDVSPPYVELYNLSSDPFELDNQCYGGLRANCRQDELQAELDDRLAKLRRCAGVEGRNRKVAGHPFCE